MAQVLVRNLDERVVARLKKRATQRGRSLQTEVKQILEEAARTDYADAWKAVERIYNKLKRSGRTFSDSAELIREDRER
ncbi:MAG: FitA-like ribbon-helix-helix domain-containing protein [Nitrospiraceae bacterium]